MKYQLEALLDACVAELEKGRDLEEILEAHPGVADELRPLLAAAAWAKIDVPPPRHTLKDKHRLMEVVALRRRVVESVDGYVNEVKAGIPLGDLVARAPAELRPLVAAAWRMESTPSPTRDPAAVAEGRRLVLKLAAQRRDKMAARPSLRSWVASLEVSLREATAGMRLTPSFARRARSATAAVTVAMVLVAGMAGVHTAAASSVPGQTFYGVKRFGESAQLLLAHDAGRRAELNIRFATRRLDEINTLAADGRSVPVDLMEDWLRGQSSAWSEIRDLPLDQRQLLAEMLLANVEARGLSDEAMGAVGAQESLEQILARSSALADAVRDSLGAATVPPVRADGLRDKGPMAVERPLPREDLEAPAPADEPPAAEVVVPVAPPEAPVAAPVVDAPAERRDEGKSEEPAAEPPPEEPAAEPPAFGAPPIAPEPQEPGAGGGLGPGSEPPPGP